MPLTTFPIHPIVTIDGEKKCACNKSDCAAVGKHPAVSWKNLKAGEQIPLLIGGGMGLVTGIRSGIFVVDCDNKEGIDGLANLEASGELPDTLTIATPSGGYHFYFKWPSFEIRSSASKLAPGIDIRGEGGMVIAPGSPHRNGGTYEILPGCNPDPVDAPEWLLTAIKRTADPIPNDAGGVAVTPIDETNPEWDYRLRRAREYLEEQPPCVAGQGGDALLWGIARYLVIKLELPDIKIRELIAPYNASCEPPWSDEQIGHKLRMARANKMGHDTGIAPEGFDLKPSEIRPQTKNASHEYTFFPGESAGAGKKRKTDLTEITWNLQCAPEWSGVWQFDEFGRKVIAINPPMQLHCESGDITDTDVTAVQCWFEINGMAVARGNIEQGIRKAADKMSYHPVKKYLESLPPGDPELLDTLATRLLGALTPIENEYLKKWLIAAVRRIYEPGCKMDNLLILYGEQGRKKSSLVNALFGEWYTDQMPDLRGRDASNALRGIWGIELPELDQLQKLEATTVKAFMSRSVERYREFGIRDNVVAPRQCVFVGTTNEEDILTDSTGNRRFWIIYVRRNIELSSFDRDSIWAAALALYRANEPHWFEKEQLSEHEASREAYRSTDAWHEIIVKYLMGKESVTLNEVHESIVVKAADRTNADQKRICRILRVIGCENLYLRNEGERIRKWKVPEHIAKMGNKKPGNSN